MANEMRTARGVAVMPKLVHTIRVDGPGVGWLRITDAGAGPASDVDVALILGPHGREIPWFQPVVAAGEGHGFIPERPGRPVHEWVRLTR